MKWHRIVFLAGASLGMLAEPALAARGGFHGGFRGGFHNFHGGGFRHGHFRHHRFEHRQRFRQNVFFNSLDLAGPYDSGYNDFYPVYDTTPARAATPVCPTYCPLPKGYSTYRTADGYYNYPPFYTAYTTCAVAPSSPSRSRARRPHKAKTSSGCAEAVPVVASSLVAEVQGALKEKGFDPGPIDGVPGAQTRTAICGFQAGRGLEMTGKIDTALLKALGL